MKKNIFIIAIIHCLSCHEVNNHPIRYNSNTGIEINIDTCLNSYDKISFKINFDFVLKQKKEYIGVQTYKIFYDLIQKYNIDSSLYDVAFTCKDGYIPIVPLNQLLNDKGYIAIKDVAAQGNWDTAMNDKFSPAYLVWDLQEDDHQHSFPYGIVKIKFVRKKETYLNAKPMTDANNIQVGFTLFKDKCIKCHAINKDGGQLAPELNYPKSVTVYWKADQLKLFIKNASTFRYNTKMPAMNELNEQDINNIIEYLTFMSTQKHE